MKNFKSEQQILDKAKTSSATNALAYCIKGVFSYGYNLISKTRPSRNFFVPSVFCIFIFMIGVLGSML